MNQNAKIEGLFSIIAGALAAGHIGFALFGALSIRAVFSQPFPNTRPLPPQFISMFTTFYLLYAICFGLLGILAIVGGIFALKKKHWGLALAGAIAGAITFFPLGVPAIIFTTLGKQEFSLPAVTASATPPPDSTPTP